MTSLTCSFGRVIGRNRGPTAFFFLFYFRRLFVSSEIPMLPRAGNKKTREDSSRSETKKNYTEEGMGKQKRDRVRALGEPASACEGIAISERGGNGEPRQPSFSRPGSVFVLFFLPVTCLTLQREFANSQLGSDYRSASRPSEGLKPVTLYLEATRRRLRFPRLSRCPIVECYVH